MTARHQQGADSKAPPSVGRGSRAGRTSTGEPGPGEGRASRSVSKGGHCPWLQPGVRLLAASLALVGSGCDDPERFTTEGNESYCGYVVQGAFVRSGFGPAVQMRLSFDAALVETGPGTLTTSDGLLAEAPLRPLAPFFHDALSSMQFGEGRERSLLYFVDPVAGGPPLTALISLMEGGDVEVRLMRAEPAPPPDVPPESVTAPLFGVFPLKKRVSTCGF
ncbi:MAG: hypothetical protein MUF34_30290 [Polyangiaceae bacterium]|nr:hypothetical protein [Polyangiaceae bacterium]